ncbi:MAG: hypothetical protein NZ699_09320 [Roseiflexus sp.]|nr:hypothetical protein [Roseiflexus sp.]MCS7289314.1 hypothetical protein [Roseiflexus sp.]MDW8231854.1 hypothetical protein [Roseiflexaceae bacterium]
MMPTITRFRSAAPVAGASLGLIGALALLWITRRAPLTLPPLAYFDALGAFFVFAVWCGTALSSALRAPAERGWRFWLTALALTVAFVTSLTPLVVAAYVLLALMHLPLARRGELLAALRSAVIPLLAAAALAAGYGALALRGVVRFDAPLAGAALDSLVFWFVLLAAAIPLLPSGSLSGETGPPPTRPAIKVAGDGMRSSPARASLDLFAFAWLYPLTRLYTLSPWNEGWSFATLTLGGGAMIWLTLGALTAAARSQRAENNRRRLIALALAGIGLSSGAGLAAGCYAVLVYLVLIVSDSTGSESESTTATVLGLPPSVPSWLLSGAFPLTAPFIATWMIVGAGAAGGVTMLTAVAWLTMLVSALPVVSDLKAAESRRRWIGGGVSLVLGVASPLVVRLLIQPVIEQLQGGLSVYGDVNVWPWVGLAMVNSARTGITALPTVGAAGLMVVLSAMVYLLARLLRSTPPSNPSSPAPAAYDEILQDLRRAVPWLSESATKASDHDDC